MVTDREALKAAACRIVDQIAEQLIRQSDWMADHPELGLVEFQAAERLAKRLRIPRSRLYARAIERYVSEAQERDVTALLSLPTTLRTSPPFSVRAWA